MLSVFSPSDHPRSPLAAVENIGIHYYAGDLNVVTYA